MKAVKIPYDQLSPEALHGVIEEFVTRDGTDYGEVEIPVETKIAQVLTQIRSGKAVIIFDQETESCTVLKTDDPLVKALWLALVEIVVGGLGGVETPQPYHYCGLWYYLFASWLPPEYLSAQRILIGTRMVNF